jgi:hypothetical protein
MKCRLDNGIPVEALGVRRRPGGFTLICAPSGGRGAEVWNNHQSVHPFSINAA